MPDYTNEFRKKVSQLPPEIKEVMLSDKTTSLISEINNKYKLNAKQSDKLPILIGKIFIKEISFGDFINLLKTQLNIDSEIAKLITIDIAKNIFIPIKRYFPGIESLTPNTTQPKNENIVNLKNLNRE
ncbi:hypothetical protein KKF60_03270 [Patescibacteria group bacterium]|nr:hypothetical protein [Patescibacteria group bacterium]MBU4458888.1 hypothetical protein [Patescibacteria group bacterium]MCG2696170.1 hypothetical protein [Candidatus Portnoybacteria bacterium]